MNWHYILAWPWFEHWCTGRNLMQPSYLLSPNHHLEVAQLTTSQQRPTLYAWSKPFRKTRQNGVQETEWPIAVMQSMSTFTQDQLPEIIPTFCSQMLMAARVPKGALDRTKTQSILSFFFDFPPNLHLEATYISRWFHCLCKDALDK